MRERVVWTTLTAFTWLFIGRLVQVTTVMLLDMLPFTTDVFFPGVPSLSEVAAIASVGFAAYGLIRFIRTGTAAPREVWQGVAIVESLGTFLAVAFIVAMVIGARTGWMESLSASSYGDPLALGEGLRDIALRTLPSAAASIFGAWRGSVVDATARDSVRA